MQRRNIITDTGLTLGDIFVGDATGKLVRRPKGAANTVLSVTSDGSDVGWSTPSTASAIPQQFAYIIRKNGTVYEAVNTATGAVDSNSTYRRSYSYQFRIKFNNRFIRNKRKSIHKTRCISNSFINQYCRGCTTGSWSYW